MAKKRPGLPQTQYYISNKAITTDGKTTSKTAYNTAAM
jgi:hypothetical protein